VGQATLATVSEFIALEGTRQKVRAMLKFILRRCLEAIPTLFILITISFFMMRLAPGVHLPVNARCRRKSWRILKQNTI
jgi:Mn2+/Fe2+ NRAMP family transporter